MIYLRLPLLTLFDMQPGMYPYLEDYSLDLPRLLGRLGDGTSLCLRHPGDALNLRLLLLRRRALGISPSHILNDLIRSFEISSTRIVFLYSDLISSRGNFCWSLFSHSSNPFIDIVPVLNQNIHVQRGLFRPG